jgi:guanylate kinase
MIDSELSDIISRYRPDAQAKRIVANTPTTLLVGISGAGKDTLRRRLVATGGYHSIVSHTTRRPRENHGTREVDGIDYHFIDQATALAVLKNHGFVEAKFYSGNVYGTSVGEFMLAKDEDKIALADVEIQGVAEYVQISEQLYPIFLVPPSYEVWWQRFQKRYQDGWQNHRDDIAKRVKTAEMELEHVLKTPYFVPVINDDIEVTQKKVEAITHGQPLSPEEQTEARKVIVELLEAIKSSTLD